MRLMLAWHCQTPPTAAACTGSCKVAEAASRRTKKFPRVCIQTVDMHAIYMQIYALCVVYSKLR